MWSSTFEHNERNAFKLLWTFKEPRRIRLLQTPWIQCILQIRHHGFNCLLQTHRVMNPTSSSGFERKLSNTKQKRKSAYVNKLKVAISSYANHNAPDEGHDSTSMIAAQNHHQYLNLFICACTETKEKNIIENKKLTSFTHKQVWTDSEIFFLLLPLKLCDWYANWRDRLRVYNGVFRLSVLFHEWKTLVNGELSTSFINLETTMKFNSDSPQIKS